MENFDFEYFKPVPDKKGYVTHDRYCTYQEFHEALSDYLNSTQLNDEYTVAGILDYVSCDVPWDQMKKQIPEFRWIYCWFTRGGNEGFYFHIDTFYHDTGLQTLFIIKTLDENLETALKINTAICRFIIETMDK